jgi:hypothetical protein
MSQQLLHHFELCADASQQSRVSMPERVPSESFLNSEPLRNGTNVLAQNRLAPHWPATPVSAACENPVVGSDIARNFLPFRECLQNKWMNRHPGASLTVEGDKRKLMVARYATMTRSSDWMARGCSRSVCSTSTGSRSLLCHD